jgi:transcriptional regulator with XRE-family HTH domain
MGVLIIGNFIKQERIKKGYTQEELSDGICTTSTLSNLENGKHLPSTEIINALLDKMGSVGYNIPFLQSNIDLLVEQLEYEMLSAMWQGNTDKVGFILSQLEDMDFVHDLIDMQYINAAKWYIDMTNGTLQSDTAKEIVKCIKTTYPQFDESGDIGDTSLLTSIEEYLVYLLCKNIGMENVKGKKILEQLYNNINLNYVKQGKKREGFADIGMILAKIMLDDGNDEMSGKIIEEIEKYHVLQGEFDKLADTAYIKATLLTRSGKSKEAKDVVVSAYFHMLAYGYEIEAGNLMEYAKSVLGITFEIEYKVGI